MIGIIDEVTFSVYSSGEIFISNKMFILQWLFFNDLFTEEDKNLVDYPFVIEFRDNENARGRNNNNDGRGQPSLQPRPPSPFQSTGQHYNQQRPQYQHNHQQFGRNNGGVNGGSMNFLNNGNGGFVGGAGDCRLVKCGS